MKNSNYTIPLNTNELSIYIYYLKCCESMHLAWMAKACKAIKITSSINLDSLG